MSGDVMVKGGDLFGDGVNIAARLQAIAEPGGVCISGAAHEHVSKALPLAYQDLGSQQVKNIAEPVRAFAVRSMRGRTSRSAVSSGSQTSPAARQALHCGPAVHKHERRP